MSPTKNAGPEKGSDLTGLLYRENIDYNGNICALVGTSANYRAPNIEKNPALMEWQCQKSSFFLVVGIKDNDCSLAQCIPRPQTFRSTMTEPLKFSQLSALLPPDHQIHSHAGRDKQKSMRFFIVIKAKDSDRGSQLITLAEVQWPLDF